MTRRYPQLLDQAREMSPYHNVKKCLPPTLWMCGTADDLLKQNKDFVDRMIAEGNDITWVTYDGMEHGFFLYGRHENRSFHETIKRIEEYLESISFM